ncbi:UNKNOWN [Stylonychia lemnae]|uniref:Transmembrane protein n=1 Tax=Stylonychia lemnae TaxID=5949 RepID=A0A078AH97_STYLE|nr:UNKNOWN [Stylonychia lemnae]|eukprot:CDW81624.1 UNKNOWN [Stylonychia lemnae]
MIFLLLILNIHNNFASRVLSTKGKNSNLQTRSETLFHNEFSYNKELKSLDQIFNGISTSIILQRGLALKINTLDQDNSTQEEDYPDEDEYDYEYDQFYRDHYMNKDEPEDLYVMRVVVISTSMTVLFFFLISFFFQWIDQCITYQFRGNYRILKCKFTCKRIRCKRRIPKFQKNNSEYINAFERGVISAPIREIMAQVSQFNNNLYQLTPVVPYNNDIVPGIVTPINPYQIVQDPFVNFRSTSFQPQNYQHVYQGPILMGQNGQLPNQIQDQNHQTVIINEIPTQNQQISPQTQNQPQPLPELNIMPAYQFDQVNTLNGREELEEISLIEQKNNWEYNQLQ